MEEQFRQRYNLMARISALWQSSIVRAPVEMWTNVNSFLIASAARLPGSSALS